MATSQFEAYTGSIYSEYHSSFQVSSFASLADVSSQSVQFVSIPLPQKHPNSVAVLPRIRTGSICKISQRINYDFALNGAVEFLENINHMFCS